MRSKNYYVIILITLFFWLVLIYSLSHSQSYDAYEIYDLDMYEQQTFDLIYDNKREEDYGQELFDMRRDMEQRMQIEELERRIEQLEDNQRKDW